MKTLTFKIPAYAAFYKTDLETYTQADMDRAIADYEQQTDGLFAKGRVDVEIPQSFVLIREGQPGFAFNDEALAAMAPALSPTEVLASQKASQALQAHIANIRKHLEDGQV
jgi:hypothetical protein